MNPFTPAQVKLGGNKTKGALRMYFCLVHAAVSARRVAAGLAIAPLTPTAPAKPVTAAAVALPAVAANDTVAAPSYRADGEAVGGGGVTKVIGDCSVLPDCGT